MTSERPKAPPSRQFFTLLTSKCALRHNGVHFFDITTSKSALKLRCFANFDLEMCFVPQRRAHFRHRNFQHCSECEVLLAFSLGSVFRATTACNFSSLIWPDGSASAALASLFFDPPSHKSLEKHSESQLFYLFPHLHLLSSDSFSSLIFSLLLFSSLIHPTSAFPSVHIVGSLTSKLPSIKKQIFHSYKYVSLPECFHPFYLILCH